MELSADAIALCRSLLALGRTRATGTLFVEGQGGTARLWVRRGRLEALTADPSDEYLLGVLLVARGEVRGAACADLGDRRRDGRPIGQALIAGGFTTGAAVVGALRAQLVLRLSRVLTFGQLRSRFYGDTEGDRVRDVEVRSPVVAGGTPAPGIAGVPGPSPIDDPPSVADVVLECARASAATVAPSALPRAVGAGRLSITRVGQSLVSEAALRPEEATIVAVLAGRGRVAWPLSSTRAASDRDCRRPHRPVPPAGIAASDRVEVSTLLGVVGSSPRAHRSLLVLKWLGAIAPARRADGVYGLLLRKHREIRRAASPEELLDLPRRTGVGDPRCAPPAGESDRGPEARRALRTLAKRLHPDRFDGDRAEPLRRISDRVLIELVRAERSLRLPDRR